MRVPINCHIIGRKSDQQPLPYDGTLWVDEIPHILRRGKDKAHKSRRKLEQLRQAAAQTADVTNRPV